MAQYEGKFNDNSSTRMGEPEATVVVKNRLDGVEVKQIPIFTNRRNPVLQSNWDAIHLITVPSRPLDLVFDLLNWVTPSAVVSKGFILASSFGVNVFYVLIPLILFLGLFTIYLTYRTGDTLSISIKLFYLALGVFLGLL